MLDKRLPLIDVLGSRNRSLEYGEEVSTSIIGVGKVRSSLVVARTLPRTYAIRDEECCVTDTSAWCCLSERKERGQLVRLVYKEKKIPMSFSDS